MNTRIKLLVKYQLTKSDRIFKKIVEEFKPLINHYLKKIPKLYQEDIYQEMLIVLNNIIINHFKINKNIKIKEDLFTIDNLNLLKANNFKNVNTIFQNPYLNKFISIYKEEQLELAFYNTLERKKLIKEFMYYCNERQFTYYINKTFMNMVNKVLKEENSQVNSLNKKVKDGTELLDLQEDQSSIQNNSLFDKYKMSDNDLNFILSFIEKGRVLTQKEVAKKYKVSQQQISKRVKEIKNKYKGGDLND